MAFVINTDHFKLSLGMLGSYMDSEDWEIWTDATIWKHAVLKSLLTTKSGVHIDCDMPHISQTKNFQPVAEYIPPENDGMFFGNLSALCNDVLFQIFDKLDPVSYHEVRGTCRRARSVGGQNPTYQILNRFVPGIARELRNLQLTNPYPITRIREEMAYQLCRECGDAGPIIHLPTCDRICWRCYYLERSYWPITLQMAMDTFHITKHEIDFSLSRTYVKPQSPVWDAKNNKPPETLITVKCARMLGVEKHGSLSKCEELVFDAITGDDPDPNENDFSQYDKMCLALFETEASSDDYFTNADRFHMPPAENPNPGVGISEFPYLPWKSVTPSDDLWYCKGCHWLSVFSFQMHEAQLAKLDLEDEPPRVVGPILTARSYMAYDWNNFVHHLDTCLVSALIMYDHIFRGNTGWKDMKAWRTFYC